MTSYSAFFSSGLLAAPQAYSHYETMPSVPSSPSTMSEALHDASDIEIDRLERERSTTPTPSSNLGAITMTAGQQPRLRKRRSSITMGTSALNAIKSPMRNVSHAFQLQRHLQLPCRSRSGSLSSVVDHEEDTMTDVTPTNNDASKRRSRMRSGSVGTVLKPRTAARTIPRAMPPPNAPLPPLPPMPLSPTHAKSFSIPPNAVFGQKFLMQPPMSLMGTLPSSPMLSSRQVLGDVQP